MQYFMQGHFAAFFEAVNWLKRISVEFEVIHFQVIKNLVDYDVVVMVKYREGDNATKHE